MTLSPGDTFDRYTIEAVIGEGGMGRVYRAHDTRLHRRVALKLLRLDAWTEPSDSAKVAARFLREARAAAALDHPNAVSVFDVAEVDGQMYIAMELIAGKTLRAFVGDDRVPRETKLRWLVDAGRALAAAHERGLVHRDVKPENIMVRDDGVVKVLDFGIAKRLEVDAPQGDIATALATQSVTGQVVGTPRYLSPEQVRGEAVDGRSDQFSWGVVAYELMTGGLPWNDQPTGLSLLLAILQDTPEPPSKRTPDLPSLVDATILKALAKAPADRFASMEFVVAALETFITASRRSFDRIEVMATTRTEPAGPPDPPPRPKGGGWGRALVVATAWLVAGAGVAFADHEYVTKGRASAAPSASAAGSSPAPPATTVIDLAASVTATPEARAAFRGFLQSFRDGAFEGARQALVRATTIDPSFAAAHLRLAYMNSLVSSDESDVRRSFKQAVQYRTTLTARDQALLDAFEPYYQGEPSDPAECEKRLAALVARYPRDAELAYYLGSLRYDRGRIADAIEAFDRAVDIDPGFALALGARGGCLAYLGRFAEARASLDACEKASPIATECLWYKAQIDEQEGKCADEESVVRVWIGRDPDDYYAYQWLAKALYGEGRDLATVETALAQKWLRAAPDRRARLELLDRMRLDIAKGDFASAERHASDVETTLAAEPGALAHAEPQTMLVDVLIEEGRSADARTIAGSFLKRKDAWVTPHRVDDRAIWEDPIPRMLGALAHTGGLAPLELTKQRDEWVRIWREKTSDGYVNYLWIYGFARPTETPAEATDALAALPSYSPLPPFNPTSIAAAFVGKVELLAGNIDDAVPWLEKAQSECVALYEPIAHTRALLDLGHAYEKRGDRGAACISYAKVLARWGAAKPRSVTANDARARSVALGCGR
jgi:tRNA A-37 threonylcarbamoyl transferase component Bud32/tetratricopeptide (TPR) repeat protein